MSKRVNWDYFKISNEIPLLLKAKFAKKDRSLKRRGKILIIDTCILGDFLVSLPALKTFIEKNKISVDLMVSPLVKSLAEKIVGVNKVFVARSSSPRPAEQAMYGEKEKHIFEKYDGIIVLKVSKESLKLLKDIDSPAIYTACNYMTRYFFHLIKQNITRKTPYRLRDMFFKVIKEDPKNVPFSQIFHFNKKDYAELTKFSELRGKEKIIIIHTGSSWPMNQWFNDRWIDLIKKINSFGKFKFIFVGKETEGKDFEEISKKLNFKIYSLIGKLSIKELLLLMRRSNYFIGIDSGPRNMAHLAELPSITLYGPGPHMFTPPNNRDIVIDKSNGKGAFQRFFYKKNSFISKITAEEVFEKFEELIKNRTKVRK